jgi:hypothetical protein
MARSDDASTISLRLSPRTSTRSSTKPNGSSTLAEFVDTPLAGIGKAGHRRVDDDLHHHDDASSSPPDQSPGTNFDQTKVGQIQIQFSGAVDSLRLGDLLHCAQLVSRASWTLALSATDLRLRTRDGIAVAKRKGKLRGNSQS